MRAILLLLMAPALCAAQDLTPRAYVVTPISSNAVILTYAFADGELNFDPTVPISDATGTIHTTVATLYSSFSFFGRSANVSASLPYANGGFRGLLNGDPRAIHRSGTADVSIRLSVNIVGAPALTAAAFAKTRPATSTLGASVKVVMPTGQYDPTRLINIGTNRWAIKPELGYTRRRGSLVLDAYAGLWLFTANDNFFAPNADTQGSKRTQDPIAALEFHVSYDVKPRLWISGDINYWRGGKTTVNGVNQTESLQSNSRFGITGSVPLTSHQAIKISYSDGVVVRIGEHFKVLSAGWQYSWLGAPFGKG